MLEVINLRCEYKDNPIGIDVTKPRISWIIQSEDRNVMQAAYQVQVVVDKVLIIRYGIPAKWNPINPFILSTTVSLYPAPGITG